MLKIAICIAGREEKQMRVEKALQVRLAMIPLSRRDAEPTNHRVLEAGLEQEVVIALGRVHEEL